MCVFSVWHELPVPNVQLFLFLCLLIKNSSVAQISWVGICSLCWKHLITLFSVNYWKWDSYSLTLHHSFGSWLFLNALGYYLKCRHVRIGHGIPVLVLLVPGCGAARVLYSLSYSRLFSCSWLFGSYLNYSGSSADFTWQLFSGLPLFIYECNMHKSVFKCSSNECTSQMLFYGSSSPFGICDFISSLHFLQILLGEW